ncbi:IclR family transcriptional regulator [Paramagnetospirillum marisnigri]|uniref:IclR family transcriptional regulator n=1 Tax=Paramagnetospirillum marisnigri TaxID=1285242 RepID=A0A178MDW4_9PROT|nr:IclR family transcriptional regulator [Paramagnetospirillum marisnigri]OAN46733.1 IclR family transcriptional regulator [Paramagnetospirillum marisnigri]
MTDAPRHRDELAQDRRFVVALARGLDVLRCFRAEDFVLGNQDIAQRTGLPKPTVSRLTHTLTRLGYLDYLERLGKYKLGSGALSLGYTALAAMDIRQVARPLMQDLADYSDVAVSLGSFDRDAMIYVESCRGKGALTIGLSVGSRLPVATSAMGRAYLAALPQASRAPILDELRRRHGNGWTTMATGIDQAVLDLGQHGFVLSLGDWHGDVHAVGVPVTHPATGEVMALNCGGAAFLLPRQRLEQDLGPRLVSVARRIELALGGLK